MRTMYDGVNASTVPAGAQIYAGYVNGSWPSHAALVSKFPKALHVTIAVNVSADAMVLDVEPGDATPAQAVDWALRQRARGNPHPVVYCNQKDKVTGWPAVKAAFALRKVAPPLYWVASYVNDPAKPPTQIPAGAIALQWYDFGGHDASLVADYWPGLDPKPGPDTDTVALEDEMAQQIEPLAVHPGEYAFGLPSGRTQMVLTADGYAQPGARLRIVVWTQDSPVVHDPVVVGGSSGHHTVGMALPAGATGVTVRRTDTQSYPVGVAFR